MSYYEIPIACAESEHESKAQAEIFAATLVGWSFKVHTAREFIVARIFAENMDDAQQQVSQALADAVLRLSCRPFKSTKNLYSTYQIAQKTLSGTKYGNSIMNHASYSLLDAFERLKDNFDQEYNGGDKLGAFLDTCDAVLNETYWQSNDLVKKELLNEGVITQGVFDLFERRLSFSLQLQLSKVENLRKKCGISD